MVCEKLCGLITAFAKCSVIFIVAVNLAHFLPGTVKFTPFNVTEPQPLTGKLTVNNLLDKSERLFEDEIKGPEGFAILNGELYTTLHGGYVARINNDKIEHVVRFGQPCKQFSKHWWDEQECGRPLGMATTEDGHLIVADAYYGIFKYNPKTGKSTTLVEKNTPVEGKIPKIFNDVTVSKDGTIYWTHSSSDFDLNNGVYAMLADPSGRLMRYDPLTGKSSVILDKLYFANGVSLSEDEDYLIVAETGMSRIRRVYLKGPKKFQSDIFMDGLPGLPDGVRPNGKKGYFVTLNVARDGDNPTLTDYIAPIPIIRRTLACTLSVLDWIFQRINIIYPNHFTLLCAHKIGHFEMIVPFMPVRATVLEMDQNGNVIESYHSLRGIVTSLSDVIIHKGHMYLGSPFNTYLGRVKLSDLKYKPVDTARRLK